MKVLFTIVSLTLMTSAFAATSGTLLLKGIVPQVLSIALTAETLASNLPLDTTQSNSKVATVNEKSNSNTGYKVTIASANLGKLTRTSGTEVFNYTLKYNNASVNLASTQTISNPAAAAVSVNKDVTISYTGTPAENMVAGEYSDTLTFTIAAN